MRWRCSGSYLALPEDVVAVGASALDAGLDGGDLLLHGGDVLLRGGHVLARAADVLLRVVQLRLVCGAARLVRVGLAQLLVDVGALLGLGLAARLQLVLAVLHRALPAHHVLLRVAAALELQVGRDAVDLRVELHAPLCALLLRAQLALLVLPAGGVNAFTAGLHFCCRDRLILFTIRLPYIGDADVATKALEHDVLDVVHVFFNFLDLRVACADRLLDCFDLRLQN